MGGTDRRRGDGTISLKVRKEGWKKILVKGFWEAVGSR